MTTTHQLRGTMRVRLCRDVSSEDGKRVYREGETVNVAIRASSDVRVWDGDRAPVLAAYIEVCGGTIEGEAPC